MTVHYREFKPSPPLSKYVECFWSLQGKQGTGEASEQILPDGCLEIIFHCGDPIERFDCKGRAVEQPKSFVSGQITEYITLKPTGEIAVFGIRFRPGGAYRFLDLPLNKLNGRVIDLDSLWGQDGNELESRIMEARSGHERIQHSTMTLNSQLKKDIESDAIVEAAINRILFTEGRISVDELMRTFGVCSRQLERRFNQRVGLPPKLVSRIVRFQRVFRVLDSNGSQSLTAVALDSGYYDQAHFIKDFRAFTGQNPTTYFANRHRMSDFFTSHDRMSNFYNSF